MSIHRPLSKFLTNRVADQLIEKRGDYPARKLQVEALEARILYSGSPAPAPEPAPTAEAAPAVEEAPAPAEAEATTESAPAPEPVAVAAPEPVVAVAEPGAPAPEDAATVALTETTLADLAEAASQRWIDSGLTAEQTEALSNITYQIADLGIGRLGVAEDSTITIDDDAAASGSWFIDSTPDLDEEFTADADTGALSAVLDSGAEGKHDLLSLLMHEQGHVLGLDHESGGVMDDWFTRGTRALPEAGQAAGAIPGSLDGAHAAITTNGTPASVGGDAADTISGYTVAAGTDRLLLVFAVEESSDTITDVTFNGSSLTFLGEVNDGGAEQMEVWYATLGSGVSATAGDIVLNSIDSPVDFFGSVVAAVAYDGVDQATPIDGFVSSLDLSTTVTSEANGDLVVGAAFHFVGALSAGAGQTEIFNEVDLTGAGTSDVIVSQQSGAASVVMDYSFSGVSNIDMSFAFNVNTATPVAPVPEIYVEHDVTDAEIADGDTTPTGILAEGTDFGAVDTTTGSEVRTFLIRNDGTAVLTLASTPVITGDPGGHFTPSSLIAGVGGSDLTLDPGDTRTFTVTFDPTADGIHTAMVEFGNDDADESPYNFEITGIGTTTTLPNDTIAVDDNYTTDEDNDLTVAAPGVVGNDLAGGGFAVVLGSDSVGTAGGVLTDGVNEDGSFTYDPNGQFEYLQVTETATDTFTYEIIGVKDPLVDRALLAPLGPGGTYNGYLIVDDSTLTWDEARVEAETNYYFGGENGHLVTITSQAEQDLIVDLGGNFFIGLTESEQTSSLDGFDFSTLGTDENNNGFEWITGEPLNYTNWANNFPNDQGSAVQMSANGKWDEISGGPTMNDGSGVTGSEPVVEFELNAPDLQSYLENGFTLREWQAATGQVSTLTEADDLIAANPNSPTSELFYSKIDLGNGGNFGLNLDFPDPGNETNLAQQMRAFVYIPTAGDYTFAASSEEGFGLRILGSGTSVAELTAVHGADDGSSTLGVNVNGRLTYIANQNNVPTLGVFNFSDAGFYEVDLVNFNNQNGNGSFEFSAATGDETAFNGNFHLVGDVASGGLGVVTNIIVEDVGTVTMTVEGVNDPPEAVGGNFTVNNTETNFSIDLANPPVSVDPDTADLGLLTVSGVVQNQGLSDTDIMGAFTVDANGVLSFDPNALYGGLVPPNTEDLAFDYTVADPAGAMDSGTVTITITTGYGTSGDDHFLIRKDGVGNIELHRTDGPGWDAMITSTVFDKPEANVTLTDLTFDLLGGDDTVTLDYGFDGGFFTTPVIYNGEGQDTDGDGLYIDRLTLTDPVDVNHDMTGSGSGNLDIDGNGNLLTYTGLELVDLTESTIVNLSLNMPTGTADDLQLSETAGILRLDGTTATPTEFTAPSTSLTITGAGDDALTVSSPIDIGGANLLANVGIINLNSGGEIVANDQTYDGAVVLGADNTLTVGGDLVFAGTVDDDGTAGNSGNLIANVVGTTTLGDEIGGISPVQSFDLTTGGLMTVGVDVTTVDDIDILVVDSIGANDDLVFSAGVTVTSQAGNIDATAGLVRMNVGSSLNAEGDVTVDGNVGIGGAGNFVGITLKGASIASANGDVTLTGEGGTTGTYSRGVLLDIDFATATRSSVTSGTGSVAITGTGGGSGLFGTGVLVNSADVSGDGVTILGEGGDTGTMFNEGVSIQKFSSIDSGSGDLVIDGTGGPNGTFNRGVSIGATTLDTDGGNIDIDGTGGGSATGMYGIGVDLVAVTATATGTGTITLTGTGAAGNLGNIGVKLAGASSLSTGGNVTLTGESNGAGLLNHGVQVAAGSSIEVTGTAAVTITGTSGTGTTLNRGIEFSGGSGASVVDGDITLRGTSRGTLSINQGVSLATTEIGSTGTGNILVEGTGGATATGTTNIGVGLVGTDITTTGTGTITLTGEAGTGSSINKGVKIAAASEVSTASGAVAIAGTGRGSASLNDGVSVEAYSTVSAGGSGTLSITGVGSAAGIALNNGLFIASGSEVTVDGGAMTLTGTGGGTANPAASVFNNGIQVSGAKVTSTAGGKITMTGNGGNGTTLNQGVRILSSTIGGAGAGELDITGAGSSTTTGLLNTGVYMLNANLTGINGGTILGTGGGGTTLNHGVYMQGIGGFVDETDYLPGTITGTAGGTTGAGVSKEKDGSFFPTLLPLLMAEADRRTRRKDDADLAAGGNPFQPLADEALSLSIPDPTPLAPGDTLVFRSADHAPCLVDAEALGALLGSDGSGSEFDVPAGSWNVLFIAGNESGREADPSAFWMSIDRGGKLSPDFVPNPAVDRSFLEHLGGTAAGDGGIRQVGILGQRGCSALADLDRQSRLNSDLIGITD